MLYVCHYYDSEEAYVGADPLVQGVCSVARREWQILQ